ncbi:MAG TPA: TadE family type IV pilus minor pilin [Nocardioidaceae bacterium]|nr:TadE family type IV pilus minor pilin [Nocardioidaceae bacterium]
MVTAETAVVLPIVAAFVLVLLWLISTVVTEVRLVDAARDAARSLARGDDEAVVRAGFADTGPAGAQLTVVHDDADVTADVSVSAQPPGWLLVPLPPIELHASATAQVEGGAEP